MPPTRFGHIMISSVHPGSAIHDSASPTIRSGTAAVPWLAKSAPRRNRLWLLPPIASAVVPTHPIVLGCATAVSDVSPAVLNACLGHQVGRQGAPAPPRMGDRRSPGTTKWLEVRPRHSYTVRLRPLLSTEPTWPRNLISNLEHCTSSRGPSPAASSGRASFSSE